MLACAPVGLHPEPYKHTELQKPMSQGIAGLERLSSGGKVCPPLKIEREKGLGRLPMNESIQDLIYS